MLHRLALRVVPQLNGLVTEPAVRKRKRLVMLAPGMIAFIVYRLLKSSLPLDDPFILLAFSGFLASLSALWSYRMGRQVSVSTALHEDGLRRIAWVVGWVGFAYGVQLSLLVLALLKIFVAYDFLLHPEGPAMMAIIIASSSVTRDAFELGHVRWKEQQGQKIVTFPDSGPFRRWFQLESGTVGKWASGSAVLAMGGAVLLLGMGHIGGHEITQSLMMSVLAGCVGLLAFYAGRSRSGDWRHGFRERPWLSIARFWLWPCLTFALTYYLVQAGLFTFLLQVEQSHHAAQVFMAGTTAALMSGYCFYLGRAVLLEAETQQGIPDNIQSCPFVMGILKKAGLTAQEPSQVSVATPSTQPESR
ncbi:MAG: hypothetical protein MRJ96_01525 [Nitrospirales bacterium]|nr:hypothetical protein [Nitrospira sp.]MDR4500123.1 hypothetical protein [Nitrospirales bacterium]